MADKSDFDPATLREAELVALTDQGAVAFSYCPGETPTTVAMASGSASESLLWCAQELKLPIVELPGLDRSQWNQLKPGQEIPESFYRPVARCLALVGRSRPGPAEVRLVRAVGRAPENLRRRLKKRASELADSLEVAQVSLTVGSGWREKELSEHLAEYRTRAQIELGLLLPVIDFLVDGDLEPGSFVVWVRGVPVARGRGSDDDPWSELGRSLLETMTAHAWRLVGYRETEALLDMVARSHRLLYRELFPGHVTVGAVRQVLRNLLRERVSIRDLPGILESIRDNLDEADDPDRLTEHVRASMREYLSNRFGDRSGVLHALVLDPAAERVILKSLREASARLWLDLDLDESLKILTSVGRGLQTLAEQKVPGVVLSSPRPRRFVQRLLEPSFPYLPVMSYSEVAPLTHVDTVCMVGR